MPQEIIEFVKAAIRNPMEVSTVFPTTRFLANTLLDFAGVDEAEVVAELGAGTGAITKHLAKRLKNPKAYVGVELDPKMVDFLKHEWPKLKFKAGLAEDLPKWITPGGVDVVVSSLPWTVFSDELQDRTIQAIVKSLKPGGVFVTYVCANALIYPQAKRFIRALNDNFQKVERSPLELRNIPPAFVYRSTKSLS